MPRFSLVVCTIGRRDDMCAFLRSLRAQTFTDFEVILVVQSHDDAIRSLIAEEAPSFPLVYLESARGLSLGRNVGLKRIGGEIIAFPDDDCVYQPDSLQKVDRHFRDAPAISGLTGRSFDSSGQLSGPRSPDSSCIVDAGNVWLCGISYTIFLKREAVAAVGDFDERLGVGSGTPFGSGEETDYLLRAIKAGFQIRYIPELKIIHPGTDNLDLKTRLDKDYRYAVGMGFVLKKLQLGWRNTLPHFVKPALGIILFLMRFDVANARSRLRRLRGRLKGYFHPAP